MASASTSLRWTPPFVVACVARGPNMFESANEEITRSEFETFSARLANPVGALLARAAGVGTIVDRCAIHDDPFFFDTCVGTMRWDSMPLGG